MRIPPSTCNIYTYDTYIHTYIHTCTHTYIHTYIWYIHTHIHTYIRISPATCIRSVSTWDPWWTEIPHSQNACSIATSYTLYRYTKCSLYSKYNDLHTLLVDLGPFVNRVRFACGHFNTPQFVNFGLERLPPPFQSRNLLAEQKKILKSQHPRIFTVVASIKCVEPL
jgi:hypothetical protein